MKLIGVSFPFVGVGAAGGCRCWVLAVVIKLIFCVFDGLTVALSVKLARLCRLIYVIL